jgi:hypothetical protein
MGDIREASVDIEDQHVGEEVGCLNPKKMIVN